MAAPLPHRLGSPQQGPGIATDGSSFIACSHARVWETHGAHPLKCQSQDRASLEHSPVLPVSEPLRNQVVLREAPIEGHRITAIHGEDAIDNHPAPDAL